MPNFPEIVIDENGLTIPTYNDYLEYFLQSYRDIYGEDIYLEEDSQDGQLLRIYTQAIYDTANSLLKVYNSFDPDISQGVALDRLVRINAIRRKESVPATVELLFTGSPGYTFSNVKVKDGNDQQWQVDDDFTIPTSGDVLATATLIDQDLNYPAQPIGFISTIATPTAHLFSVTNPSMSIANIPIESDYDLRLRRFNSVELNAYTLAPSILANINELSGVTESALDDNDTNFTNAKGTPAHSIAVVVEGGDSQEIAQVIHDRKTIGCGTHGEIHITVYDQMNIEQTISFSRPLYVNITVTLVIQKFDSWVDKYEDIIKYQVYTWWQENVKLGNAVAHDKLWTSVVSVYTGKTTIPFNLIQVCFNTETGGIYVNEDLPANFITKYLLGPIDIQFSNFTMVP